MKKITLLAVWLSCSMIFQQAFATLNYDIQGNINGLKNGTVYLKYGETGRYMAFDSAAVKNGKFRLKGKIAEAQLISVYLRFDGIKEFEESKYSFQLFIADKSKLNILGDFDKLNKVEIKGGNANEVHQILLNNPGRILRNWTYYLGQAGTAEQQENFVAAKQHRHKADSLRNVFLKESELNQDFTSSVQGLCIFNSAYRYLPLADAVAVLNSFSASLKSSIYFKQMIADLERQQRLQAGMMAPEFVLPDTAGKMHQLKDFRGKYVLIDFGASWCYWCKKETPFVMKAYEAYKKKGLVVINISLDTESKLWVNDVKKENHPWISLSDLQGWKGKVAQDYYVKGVPHILIVDPEGKIIANGLRGTAIDRHLSTL